MKKTVILILFTGFSHLLSGSVVADKNKEWRVAGSASVTNNGISLIPNFSLGEPAAQFNLSVGGDRLRFDTDFNFSWEGKPWYILYWIRYQMVEAERFQMSTSTHLGMNFKPSEVAIAGRPENMLITERYWVAELFPRYQMTPQLSAGILYLFSIGLDPGTAAYTHFVNLNTTISQLKLINDYQLSVSPQIYYLKQERTDGFYFTSSITLGRQDNPISVSTLFNQVISSEIAGSKDFVWNISLKYSW